MSADGSSNDGRSVPKGNRQPMQVWSHPLRQSVGSDRSTAVMNGYPVNVPANMQYYPMGMGTQDMQYQCGQPQQQYMVNQSCAQQPGNLSLPQQQHFRNISSSSLSSSKKRVARACDHCRKRKIKCNEVDPKTNKCSNCTRYKAECTFKNWDEAMYIKKRKINEQDGTPILSPTVNYSGRTILPPSQQQQQLPLPENQNNAFQNVPQNMLQAMPMYSTPTMNLVIPPELPSNNTNADPSPDKSTFEQNATTRPTTVSSAPPPPAARLPSRTNSTNNSATSNACERIEAKVAVLFDRIGRLEWMIESIVKQNAQLLSNQSHNKEPKNKPNAKQYTTCILTMNKLEWMSSKLFPSQNADQFIAPLHDLLTVSLKWYVVQVKKLMDFTSPTPLIGKVSLYPLPPKEQTVRLLENFRAPVLSSIVGLVGLDECLELANRYYHSEESKHRMSYSELLLLNVSICSGASVTQFIRSGDSYHLRKDRHDPSRQELKVIESNTLLNSMYYYNKLSILSAGTKTLQGLLLLSGYLQSNVNSETAIGVLSTAIRYAVDMGLNEESYYKNLPLNEIIIRSTIWWRCYSKDKFFSLMLSRPPMIRDQDMNVFTDENYLEIIRDILTIQGLESPEEVSKVQTLDQALNYIVNFSEYIPLFFSYYSSSLMRMESHLYYDFFSVRSTLDYSLDEIIGKGLKIRGKLLSWEESLHPCMKLKSYKQYLSSLYVHNPDGNPALFFEIACVQVLRYHFRYLYLRVILSLFMTSFLFDNRHLLSESSHDIPSLFLLFSSESKEMSSKMLELFQTFDYQPYLDDELIHHFLTGVFVLFLYVVRCVDDIHDSEVPGLLSLLQSTHTHLIGENEENLFSDNLKWNVSIFFYTYFLQSVINSFNKNNPKAGTYHFNSGPYAEMLSKIMKYCHWIKNNAVDQLLLPLNTHAAHKAPPEDTPETPTLQAPSVAIFGELTANMLENLRSDKPFELFGNSASSTPKTPKRKDDEKEDLSLFPIENSSFSVLIEALNSGHVKPSSPPHEEKKQQEGTPLKTEIIGDSLPTSQRGELFYDREFFFSEAVRDYGFPTMNFN